MATVYTVKKGDTLSEIAAKYNTTVAKLVKLNGIENPNYIVVGQKIQIDGAAKVTISKNTNKAIIKAFGLQSNTESTIYVTWTWSTKNTENYQVKWEYDTGDGVWFVGNDSTVTIKQSTYSAPSNAKRVRFKVKPISKKKTVNNKETNYWTAKWSDAKIYYMIDVPPSAPSAPNVSISDDNVLTARLDNITAHILYKMQFQIIKDDKTSFKIGTANVITSSASYSCTVTPGSSYKVRCRLYKNKKEYTDWSEYSSNISAAPITPSGITDCRVFDKEYIFIMWSEVKVATEYEIQYTTNPILFDLSDEVKSTTSDKCSKLISGLTMGETWYFRVRALKGEMKSGWTSIASVIFGTTPDKPTTWSSTTTAITGEPLKLYWMHNCEDGSRETYAEIRLYINDTLQAPDITVSNTLSEDDDTGVHSYDLDTSLYSEGVKIKWCVRTAGVTETYGKWSTERVIDIYAKPTLELGLTDVTAELIDAVKSFPIYVTGLAGPSTQAPIGYHLSVISKQIYETVDNVGNVKMVNEGEEVYSSYIDTTDSLLVELSPSNLDLENNMDYTVKCVVSMDSGLTAEASLDFSVSWTDEIYEPNAEISINEDVVTASIRPYCEYFPPIYYKVDYTSGSYVLTEEILETIEGTLIEDAATTTYEPVYSGTDSSGTTVYYTIIESEEPALVTDISLSVYRREYDGTFTELATGINNESNTYILDPHPALDYARYRVVAISNSTGAVSYYDVPGHPIGEYSAIIQWDEEWKYFETTVEDELEQPPWSGSMLRLPYNIDVSDSRNIDVSLVEYIGRKHPVSYYGTQTGESSSWSVDVPKDDKETLYALRKLSIWMGDVYVREPSGSGYWASISVSFSQTHCELIIPVRLDITRVEGGK